MLRKLLKPIRTYLCDLITLLEDHGDFAVRTRVDCKGDWFWGCCAEARAAIKSIKKQLRSQKVPYSNARFGGLRIKDRAVAHEVYEALSKQGGYPMRCVVAVGPLKGMTLIDTP